MKHNLLKSVILSVILLMGVSNAWAGAGIFYGQINLEKDGGEYIAHTNNYSTAFALGKIQNLSIKATYSKVWRDNGGDITSATLCYKLYSSTKEFIPETSVGMGWLKNFDNSNDQEWGKEGINSNLTSNLVPGDSYTLEFWFYANGKEDSNSDSKIFWFSNNGGNYKVTFTYDPTFTISVQAGTGGNVAKSSVTAGNINAVTLPKATPSNGYSFDKWTVTLGDLTLTNATSASAATVKARSTGTVTANFKGNTYKVTLNNQSATTAGTASVTATYGSAMPSANMPAKTGYTFGGYYTTTNGGGTQYYTANGASAKNWDKTAATTLYAKWTANTYTVTFNKQSGTGGTNSVTATYDATMPSATMPTRTGYTFNGYFDVTSGGTKYYNANGTSARTWNKTAATTLYAQWTENKYNIVISTDGNGTTNQTGTKSIGIVGISITATPKIGSAFKQWEVTGGAKVANATSATTTITATSAGTVKAVFEEKFTTIYLEPTGHWNSDNPQYVAHVWNGSGDEKDIIMTEVGEAPYKYYKAEVPYGYTDVVFFRNSPDGKTLWNKTGDLTIPTDNNVLYTITSAGKGQAEGYNPAASGVWKAPNLIYTITLGYCDFGTYGIKYNGQSYFSKKPYDNVTIDVPAGAQIEILEGQPFSNAYTGDVVKKQPTNEKLTTGQTLTINGDVTLDDNFVTKTSHVVYLGIPDEINTTEIWAKADKANFIYTWDTYAGYGLVASTGNFRIDALGITYYKFTIPQGRHSFRFQRKSSLDDKGTPHCESVSLEHEIPLTDVNCFTLKNEKDDNRYKGTWGVLPAQPGDYRLLYVEQVVEKSKKAGDEWKPVITRKKAHPSDIIRKRTESGVDTVSLHTYKDRTYMANAGGSEYESSNNPEIILQKYLGNDQWQDVECQMVYGPLETLPIMANLPGRKNASPNSNIDDLQYQDGIENIKKDVLNHQDKGNGVWNFVVTQDGDKASVQWNETHRYTGEYYIRTDNAQGGWDQYTLNDNYMTYSQYAKDHSGFSHYFCRWVEKNITPNTKFVIANDHGVAISDTLAGDQFTDKDGNIQENANIRWSWNMVNNEIARAYIQGTWKKDGNEGERNRNLVVNYKPSSEGAVEDLLDDSGDWIYQKDFPVKVGSHLNSLTAQYPVTTGPTQTFASNLDMLTGDPAVNDKDYKVRILYDFKINKTLVALVPNANEASIAIDVVIERINQDEATQVLAPIAYTNNQRSGEGSTVYGVMSFDKSHLTGQSLSSQQKLTYWISFPFDVKLSEIFGFGEVGDYWMIKYYDGKDRAAKGLYDDNTFWKFITNRNYTLKANQGYVLALNKKVMDANSPIFTNTTRISLYFPSKEKLLNIDTDYTQTTCTIPEYTCTITSPTDRRTKDSNWNFIGVPSFANKNRNTTNENLMYFYDYDYQTDTYSVALNNRKENTFKSMFAYMVQFAGIIDWSTLASNGSQGLAAKKTDNVEKHVLRIELQQNNTKVDQTYIQLEDEEVTAMFDMNYDLTKLFNSKTNIYSLIPSDTDPIQVAANVMPIEETIIPLGIKLDAAGEYTFAMPDGTDGIVVELIDYETNTRTNMLLDEYTVNLGKGTFENRFALHVKPDKTTTSVDNIGNEATGDKVKKYLIDGILYMQKDGVLYDAQGKLVR